MRCPGMTLTRMPMFVWVMLVDSWMIVIAIPPLTAAQIMLLIDRFLGGNFFNTQAGGSAVLWQHFFWIFGHPEVYILIFPAFAILSEVIPIFSRKPIFGRPAMVGAVVAIGFISLGVWAHHMFAVGMTSWSNIFFAASSMLVGIPTGIKIFNWTATMYGGKLRLDTPMLFCCAFLLQFLVAGLTGIMLAVAPFDWQLHDSYFVVGAFSLHADWRPCIRIVRRDVLLVSESDRKAALRQARPMALLAVRDRLRYDVRSAAFSGDLRNAAADLHVCAGPGLGVLEPGFFARRDRAGGGDRDFSSGT